MRKEADVLPPSGPGPRRDIAEMEGRAGLPIAFRDEDGSVVVNFGILTGREATPAEIDRLARSVYQASGSAMTITAARRHDYADDVEAVSHQVHVRIEGGSSPDIERLCREWASSCADDRRLEALE